MLALRCDPRSRSAAPLHTLAMRARMSSRWILPPANNSGNPKSNSIRLHGSVASLEEVSANKPTYECCTFRGSLVALEAATGKVLWQTYAIPDAPKPIRKNSAVGAHDRCAAKVDLRGHRRCLHGRRYEDDGCGCGVRLGLTRSRRETTGWSVQGQKPGEGNCPEKIGRISTSAALW